MKRRLILLFDGTWNTPVDETNVSLLKDSIARTGKDGVEQITFYHDGVGTHWYNRLTGGAFGRGLSENIQDGYRWLSKNYAAGDQLFCFGFSRGAYTARSLVGLLRKCGILKNASEDLVEQAYALYRRKDLTPDVPEAKQFRDTYAWPDTRVRFIGVWDTVGALGIPVSHVPFSRDFYRFHDTELSGIVDYAYHAIAVDEHRKDYDATVWTKTKPQNLEVEQRWFAGAHANVGGSYARNRLHKLSLRWIQEKAERAGIAFREVISLGEDDYLDPIRDSFREFMWGIYALFHGEKPFYRTIGQGANEVVDDSASKRVGVGKDEQGKPYSPPNLEAVRSSVRAAL